MNGALENKPDITTANYPTWEQGASRVMYCLATCVHDHMLSHIRDAKKPKEAWENLKKMLVYIYLIEGIFVFVDDSLCYS